MDKNNHIDDLFRSKLSNYQPDYVPEHWQMMKAAMESSPKVAPIRSGNFTAKLLIVLSAIIIVGSGIYAYMLTQKPGSSETRENVIAQLKPFDNAINDKVENKLSRNMPSEQNSSSPINFKNNALNANTDVKGNSLPVNTGSKNDNSQKNNIKNQNTKPTTTAAFKETNSSANSVSIIEKPLTNNSDNIALADKDVLEPLIKPQIENLNNQVVTENIAQFKITETKVNDNQSDSRDKKLSSEIHTSDESAYTSVVDDYLAKKEKQDKKHQKLADRKENYGKHFESLPDCKVSMVNNFVINPAYAGFNQRHTISLSTLVHKPLYKPSNDFNVPFEYSIAYDFNFGKRKNCGIGVNYKRYLGAAEGSLVLDLTFAYRIALAKEHNLRLGLSASYLASNINKDNLSFSDMIDSRDGFVYNTNEVFPGKTAKNNFDLGLGVWYNWKTLFVGLSAIHLTSPDVGVISQSRIPREYMLSGGYGFNISKKLNTLPAFELKYNGKLLNFSPSMLFTYKRWLLFGVEFQNLRNAGLVLGFNLKNNVIINIHSGMPMNKDIIRNFGVVDYAGLSLRFQFGNYR
ncbi:MAG: PorP/SprF family type IX secretion system membrane protein [Bacteroidota bacterium]